MMYWASIVFVSLLLGAGSALWLIGRTFASPIRNGPWQYNPLVGSTAANAYLRATIAKVGLLALNRSEAIYLIANRDSDGQLLRGDFSYRIEGVDVAVRWWSITVYGEDSFLMRNESDRYSYNSKNIARNSDRSYHISLSALPRSGNWIPIQKNRPFDLTLRLYNPSDFVLNNLGKLALPKIIKETSV